ncbi:hypothetical protein DFA_04506 [Cavenderia fasciculata]|uniref:Transmembrane protein n=1 Tax=Cavenderia fasciculata TaxID=261658 RepID=F4PPS5_CACFS|nr:uncharacterized protein DFA_04506 [Cavenderia fasciculata]EGG22388.1 hypothetical protein DFA_04506 [Cavenderia fasciculata]|eukprot:XP_004360239.1 hypothetical protein DFA_04506 [Cavenderia fasciculata]
MPTIELEQLVVPPVQYDKIEKMDCDMIKSISLLNTMGISMTGLDQVCIYMIKTLKDQQKGVAGAKGGVAAMAGVGAGMAFSPLFLIGFGLLIFSGVGGAVTSAVDLAVGENRMKTVTRNVKKLEQLQAQINTILSEMFDMFLLIVDPNQQHEQEQEQEERERKRKEKEDLAYYLTLVYFGMKEGTAIEAFTMIQNELLSIPIDNRNINGFVDHILGGNQGTYVGRIQRSIGLILLGRSTNNPQDAIESFRNASVSEIKENAYARIAFISTIGIIAPTASAAIRACAVGAGAGAGIMVAKATGKLAVAVLGKVCIIASPVISLADCIIEAVGDSGFIKAIKKIQSWGEQVMKFYSSYLRIIPENQDIQKIPRVIEMIDDLKLDGCPPAFVGMFGLASKGYKSLDLGTTTYYFQPRENICITTSFGTVIPETLRMDLGVTHLNPTTKPNHLIVSCESLKGVFISFNVRQWKGNKTIAFQILLHPINQNLSTSYRYENN